MDDNDKIELKKLLQSYPVRKLFYDVLQFCGAFSQNGYVSDPHLANFLMGRRNVGMYLMKELEEAQDDVLWIMMKEAQRRKEEDDRRDSDVSDE